MRRFVGFATIAALMVAFAGCLGGEEPATAPEDCPPDGTNTTTNTTTDTTADNATVDGDANATGPPYNPPVTDSDCPPSSNTTDGSENITV